MLGRLDMFLFWCCLSMVLGCVAGAGLGHLVARGRR